MVKVGDVDLVVGYRGDAVARRVDIEDVDRAGRVFFEQVFDEMIPYEAAASGDEDRAEAGGCHRCG